MKTFVTQLPRSRKLELLICTGLFFVALCLIAIDANDDIAHGYAPNKKFFDRTGVPFLFYGHYFYPLIARIVIYFAGFLALNFWVLPSFLKTRNNVRTTGLLAASFLAVSIFVGLTVAASHVYLFTTDADPAESLLRVAKRAVMLTFMLFLFTGAYNAVKGAVHYVLSNAPDLEARYAFVNREGLLAFLVWFVSLLLMIVARADRGAIIGWITVIPTAILFYWTALSGLIPSALKKKRAFLRYMLRVFLFLVPVVLTSLLALFVVIRNDSDAAVFAFFNGTVQLFVTAPLSWIVYKQKQKGKTEISSLKNALGQTHAHFDFLRSQINPHFLFNALNTLYGTALQENADRTAEGVERLSSMMRFMLQENTQERIALTREIEYLNNYIALQRLRTAAGENISLEVNIDDRGAEGLSVAPMLLIPFVENAFKHGISFKSPSFILISLEVRNNQLLFDVSNSRHEKRDNDPENASHGIGLKNVQERLKLLYPDKHELTVRETAKQFFVHLTLQLRST